MVWRSSEGRSRKLVPVYVRFFSCPLMTSPGRGFLVDWKVFGSRILFLLAIVGLWKDLVSWCLRSIFVTSPGYVVVIVSEDNFQLRLLIKILGYAVDE